MFPKTVKIGGLIYKVAQVEDLSRLEMVEDLAGMIYYREVEMKIDKDLPPQIANHTLIHEMTHGILQEAGYTEHEEEMADRIGKVLYQVLVDNDFNFLRPDIEITVDTDQSLGKQLAINERLM